MPFRAAIHLPIYVVYDGCPPPSRAKIPPALPRQSSGDGFLIEGVDLIAVLIIGGCRRRPVEFHDRVPVVIEAVASIQSHRAPVRMLEQWHIRKPGLGGRFVDPHREGPVADAAPAFQPQIRPVDNQIVLMPPKPHPESRENVLELDL